MSYEAWGDDDDGLDKVREHHENALIEDGWLSDLQVDDVLAYIEALQARIARGLVGRVFPDSKFILSDVQKDRKELLALVEARKRVALVVLED
jgi:hypothetical protein